ncbi:hypothetical protein [Zwartia sp.]|uniref:hypothetical protein n=1 Tax=Zwartia sp. TaxID=2978004 RepID=UPI0027287A46|nr:hypothetical protein [Zwartia sp.]MDO9024983.1 hypothetical protein [Zwartia sp.]
MKNRHLGSCLDDWLREEGLLENATDEATKRVVAWKTLHLVEKQKINKYSMDKNTYLKGQPD